MVHLVHKYIRQKFLTSFSQSVSRLGNMDEVREDNISVNMCQHRNNCPRLCYHSTYYYIIIPTEHHRYFPIARQVEKERPKTSVICTCGRGGRSDRNFPSPSIIIINKFHVRIGHHMADVVAGGLGLRKQSVIRPF